MQLFCKQRAAAPHLLFQVLQPGLQLALLALGCCDGSRSELLCAGLARATCEMQ